ncbi:hypothetical protein SDC9_186957 [bioreactor metagenome]|uniref:Uncharacterized protein n=1 Tax=bioreactor metagenome TaxID=1076179 RepID=A0A645HME9_9ZZZZ
MGWSGYVQKMPSRPFRDRRAIFANCRSDWRNNHVGCVRWSRNTALPGTCTPTRRAGRRAMPAEFWHWDSAGRGDRDCGRRWRNRTDRHRTTSCRRRNRVPLREWSGKHSCLPAPPRRRCRRHSRPKAGSRRRHRS